MVPAVFGTHVPAATRALSIWAGQRDITSDVLADSLVIEDAGDSQGRLTATIDATLASLPELTDQAFVRVFDETQGTEMFRGFVKGRRPSLVPGWTRTDLVATDHGELLDAYIPGPVTRPAGESDDSRIGYLWGYYASPLLSHDLSSVRQIRSSMPAQTFEGVTLRRALDMIVAQAAPPTARWYLDQTGKLHYFSTAVFEGNAAPKNITSDTPGAGEIAPEDLEIDYDSGAYANTVYVNGQTAAGSGWVYDHDEIARVGTVVSGDPLDAPDCTTSAMRDALGEMYLGRVAGSTARGSFTTTSAKADGWRAGQTLDARSAAIGIDSNFRIGRVVTTQLRPGFYRYKIEFGGSQRGVAAGSGGGSGTLLSSGPLVYGDIGGVSNAYVTSDGLRVTDGSTIRAELGALGSGDYGLRVTSSDGTTVIIDGTSNMFKIAASGTITISSGPANGAQVSASVDNLGSGLSGSPANNCFTQGQILPYFTFGLGSGALVQIQEGFTSPGTNPGTAKVTFRWSSISAGVGGASATIRYYVFSEATI